MFTSRVTLFRVCFECVTFAALVTAAAWLEEEEGVVRSRSIGVRGRLARVTLFWVGLVCVTVVTFVVTGRAEEGRGLTVISMEW